MKVADIRELSNDKLKAELDIARENYFKLRFQFSTGQLTDYNQLKSARRDIARLAMVVSERQLEAKKDRES
ncbi:MAG: 50S ribosomal protein L29 [Anaerolineales bacterium]|nr:50S ribosomal protein L29 [Anaerolineales bacterium]